MNFAVDGHSLSSSSPSATAAAATSTRALTPPRTYTSVTAADGEAPDSDASGNAKLHVTRDIDGREIRDDDNKVDLKFILAHSPNVDEEEDDDVTSSGKVEGDRQCPIAGFGHIMTANASALIESQFQPVDDEDVEYGEFFDENVGDEDSNGPSAVGQRQRRSSLKNIMRSTSTDTASRDANSSRDCSSPVAGSSSGRSSPGSGSLHERKAVRFVDGPGLEDRRELVSSDEPPEVPESALKDLCIRRRKRSQSILTWTLDFEQPGSDPGFVNRVLKYKVSQ